jgi:hypothetical protein
MIWLPGHEGIVGDVTADLRARTGYEHPFIGTEPACGISIGLAKGTRLESATGLTQAKGLISGPSARRTKGLLKLNRDQ